MKRCKPECDEHGFALRERAEQLLRHSLPMMTGAMTEDAQALVYELCLSQVELKLQNEELRQTQSELEHLLARFEDLYNHAPAGYVSLDENAIVHEANMMVSDLLGQPHDALIGQSFMGHIEPASRGVFGTFIRRAMEGSTSETCEIRLKSGTRRATDVQMTCRVAPGVGNHAAQLQMTISDITLLKQTQERLSHINETLERRVAEAAGYTKLLGDVARISNESDAVDDAFRECLELICHHMGWGGGHIWMVDGATVTDSGIWFRDFTLSFSDIIKATSAVLSDTGSVTALRIRRVTRTGQPDWLLRMGRDARDEAISAAGFAQVLWFPVLARRRVVGILEFFSRQSHSPDCGLLDAMAQAGMQLGRVVERKEAESALRESEQRFRALFAGVPVGIAMADLAGRPLIVNDALQAMLGRSEEELQHTTYKEFLHLHDAERGQVLFEELVSGKRDFYDAEIRFMGRDNRTRWARVNVRLLRCPLGWPSHTMAIVEDITERKELERAVAELTVHEQQKILGYLHDDLGQQLTGIGYVAKSLQHKLEAKGEAEAATVAELVSLIVKTHDQLRLLVAGLGPVDVETKTLVDALAQLAGSTTKLSGVPCHFTCPRKVFVTDSNAATQLSYIAREAVATALQTPATRIHIGLNEDAGVLRLTVGFDAMLSDSSLTQQEGIGLRIMRYRAGLIGADLDIEANMEKGVLITCVLRGEFYENGE